MKHNPFTSDIFTTTWLKHFNNSGPGISFDFLEKLLFVGHKIPKLYVNCGKTHTKGINYAIDNSNIQDLKGKVLLIYDVPTYLNCQQDLDTNEIKTRKIRQYPGFLIKLENFKDLNDYINFTFKGKSRNKLKRDKKRLENCFDISYKIYYGEVPKEEYNANFESFRKLLEKRFQNKGISNNNLNSEEWEFYYEVAYPMIQQKKACLLVVREGNRPISFMLNFLSEDKLFQFMMGFDIDYAKFNVGTTSIMKLVEWCLEKEVKILDFSKGYFDFKRRWGNLAYRFEYHVIYDQNSFYSKIMAYFIISYFQIKQFLRDKRLNEVLHRIKFQLKSKKTSILPGYTFHDPDKPIKKTLLKQIDLYQREKEFLKPSVCDFLYYNSEALNNTTVFAISGDPSRYLIVGKNTNKILKIN